MEDWNDVMARLQAAKERGLKPGRALRRSLPQASDGDIEALAKMSGFGFVPIFSVHVDEWERAYSQVPSCMEGRGGLVHKAYTPHGVEVACLLIPETGEVVARALVHRATGVFAKCYGEFHWMLHAFLRSVCEMRHESLRNLGVDFMISLTRPARSRLLRLVGLPEDTQPFEQDVDGQMHVFKPVNGRGLGSGYTTVAALFNCSGCIVYRHIYIKEGPHGMYLATLPCGFVSEIGEGVESVMYHRSHKVFEDVLVQMKLGYKLFVVQHKDADSFDALDKAKAGTYREWFYTDSWAPHVD